MAYKKGMHLESTSPDKVNIYSARLLACLPHKTYINAFQSSEQLKRPNIATRAIIIDLKFFILF
jgi:hypothetical protein